MSEFADPFAGGDMNIEGDVQFTEAIEEQQMEQNSEPEVNHIAQWREEMEAKIRKMMEDERQRKIEAKKASEEQLIKFYTEIEEKRAQKQSYHRDDEKKNEEEQAVHENPWKYVVDELIDLSQSTETPDQTRMRQMLIQLKNKPIASK
eukprot:TRINITY_DN2658_c0_g1_i1.p1 TRINITY_DN2658_c0_g1~~TRINITY_DN2658_c0_g1_i1.p1  ORF type:complete len:148 (-),score=56.77 TRINITY_DN2658_c0_g1_i1:289-732(-)